MKISKNIIIGGLCLLIGIIGYFWYQSNHNLKEQVKIAERYQTLYDHTQLERDSLQQHSDSIQVVLDKYKYLIDSLETIVETNHTQISYLNSKLEEALEDIQSATTNEQYGYLQERFPTNDSLDYPFSGEQVGYLAASMVSYDYVDSLLDAHIDIAILQQKQLAYKDEIIGTLENEKSDLNAKAQQLYKTLAIQLEDLQKSEAEKLRLKKALRMWQAGSIGAGSFIILVLLLM